MTSFERQIPSLLCGTLLTLVLVLFGGDNPLGMFLLVVALTFGWATPLCRWAVIPAVILYALATAVIFLPHWL